MQGSIDVATPTSVKGIISGTFQLVIGLAFLGLAGVGLYLGLFHANQAGHKEPAVALVAIPAVLIGWSSFATAIRRFREVGGGWYVKAGPAGIALRIPGRPTWSSLRLGFRVVEAELPWERVKRYYPWVMKINGIPTQSEVRIELVGGGFYSVPAVLFRETRTKLAAKIKDAAKV